MAELQKKRTGYWSSDIWPTLPATIHWLQQERDAALVKNNVLFKTQARYKGINATIVLLSACCIEGFLTSCLESFASRLNPEDSFTDRLNHFYLKHVSNTTFKDFPELFRLAVGKRLSDVLPKNSVFEDVQILFRFRNGLAHSRPAIYNLYSNSDSIEPEPELIGQYKDVETYLTKRKLSSGGENIFNVKVADHFAGLLKPFIFEILSVLPTGNAKSTSHLVGIAFREIPKQK